MPSIMRLQERIAVLMEDGATLKRVEREVIEASRLSSEQKSALWLYAFSLAEGTSGEALPYGRARITARGLPPGNSKASARPRRGADRTIARYLAELSVR